jgi:murein DD-endopeptidase MepM/ murein hydrolase activator NlpD
MIYRTKRRHTFWAVPFLLVVVLPVSVHAGLFSMFMGAEVNNIEEQEEIVYAFGSNAQTMSLLRAAYNPDPNPAKGGGDVIVDDGALKPDGDISEETKAISRTSNGEISVYVVREADTLSQIAEMFDVSAKTILWANDIKDPSVIRPGDTLIILPITGVRHVVKEGETISTIAKKYDGDVEEILAYNQLSSADEIGTGDTVVVPNGVMANTQTKTYAATPVSVSGAGAAAAAGSSGYAHPLPGSVKSQGIHGYNGVDLAAPIGSSVLAAAGGEVIVSKSSGWNGGYGQYVVVKHPNGTQTLYAHLSANVVGAGQSVATGQVVGRVGNTGRSTGAHLHFEVRGARNPF